MLTIFDCWGVGDLASDRVGSWLTPSSLMRLSSNALGSNVIIHRAFQMKSSTTGESTVHDSADIKFELLKY